MNRIRRIVFAAAACAALSTPALAGDVTVKYRADHKALKRGLTGGSLLRFSFFHDGVCSLPFEEIEIPAGAPDIFYEKVKPMRVKRSGKHAKQVEIRFRTELAHHSIGTALYVRIDGPGIAAIGDPCQKVESGMPIPVPPGVPGVPGDITPLLGSLLPFLPGLTDVLGVGGGLPGLPVDGIPGGLPIGDVPNPTALAGLAVVLAHVLLPDGDCGAAQVLAQTGAWLDPIGLCDARGDVVFELLGAPFSSTPICVAQVLGDVPGAGVGTVPADIPVVPTLSSLTLGGDLGETANAGLGLICIGLP